MKLTHKFMLVQGLISVYEDTAERVEKAREDGEITVGEVLLIASEVLQDFSETSGFSGHVLFDSKVRLKRE